MSSQKESAEPKLNAYLEKLKKIEELGQESVLIFRGQSEKWPLISSAERELNDSTSDKLVERTEAAPTNPNSSLLELVERMEDMLNKARSEGYGNESRSNDLELLAAMQHQGAKTCLIDFTSNFHIALWFASQDDGKDGEVFIVNRGDKKLFSEITSERAKKSIKDLLNSPENSDHYWYWDPTPQNLIIAQHSCFILPQVTYTPQNLEDRSIKIKIKINDKETIRKELETYFGLTSMTIFRDFTGFCRNYKFKALSSEEDNKYPSLELVKLGNHAFQRGDYNKAIEDYDEAIKLDPNYFEAYNNRGLAWAKLEEYNKAIDDFTKAIKLNPKLADAYYNRGIAWYELKEYNKAIADYGKAIKLNPKLADAYYNRGIAWYELKKYDKAIDDFTKAIKLNPKLADAYYNRGIAWYERKEYDKAIADYGKAIKLNPNYSEAYYNRGNAWDELEEYNKAIADYGKAIKLNPNYSEAYNNRGNAWDALKKYEEAIDDYDEAIELNPNDSEAYYNRGLAWDELKEYNKAIADYGKAIKLNPKLAEAYYNRGNAWDKLKEYDKAIADYDEAIKLNPNDSDAYNNRKIAWDKLNYINFLGY